MFESNIQRVTGRGMIANSREQHNTRGAAYKRVRDALTVAEKPKNTVYYAGRRYTVVL